MFQYHLPFCPIHSASYLYITTPHTHWAYIITTSHTHNIFPKLYFVGLPNQCHLPFSPIYTLPVFFLQHLTLAQLGPLLYHYTYHTFLSKTFFVGIPKSECRLTTRFFPKLYFVGFPACGFVSFYYKNVLRHQSRIIIMHTASVLYTHASVLVVRIK